MKMRYLLVGMVILLLLPFSVSAERTLPLVVDRADLLSESEERERAGRLDRVSAELQCEIAVVTVSSLGGKKAEAFADDFFDQNGYGYGDEDDGVLLLIAVTERAWHITTHGFAHAALGNGALDGLEDRMTPSLSAGQYDKAFKTFALGCEYYVRYERDPSSVDQDSIWRSYLKDEPRPGVILLIAALMGMGVGGGGLLVLALVWLFDIPQRTAQGINLAAFVVSAASSMLIAVSVVLETKRQLDDLLVSRNYDSIS